LTSTQDILRPPLSSPKLLNSVNSRSVQYAEANLSPLIVSSKSEEHTTISKRPTEDSKFSPDPINDLCNVISNTLVLNQCFGYLVDEQNKRHQLVAKDRSEITESKHFVSLAEVLTGEKRLFSRQQRMMVAAVLMTSLLELSHTQWLENDWSKRDIYFMRSGDCSEILFHRPYVFRNFNSNIKCVRKETDETRNLHKGTILRMFLQSLGIVLIELCFGRTIEEIGNTQLLRPVDMSNRRSYHTYCLAIANSIEWEVVNGEDPTFSDPVDFCLRFRNMKLMSEGKDDEVMHEIFLAVVKPLHEEMLIKWPDIFREAHI
jgi:hypothetical protein